MNTIEFLSNISVKEISKNHYLTQNKKRQVVYNLFTISSYTSHLENFHSDILASLMNPQGLHQQGDTFLMLFIEYLNKFYQTNIDSSNFKDARVSRETGRLDIWIRDETSKQSIIIENKINNATDMAQQLDRYFDYAENQKKYPVKAVVYLSLDGSKKAPASVENFDSIVKNLAAFSNNSNDLVNGWLKPSLNVASNMDSQSVLHQYINLLQHLSNSNMDSKNLEELYHFISTNHAVDTVKSISEMYNRLGEHRATKFADSIKDIKPFSKQYRYRPNYWLFDNFIVGSVSLKLDVWFDVDGTATMVLWNTTQRNREGRTILTEILNAVNLENEFSNEISYADNGYLKRFEVGNEMKTPLDVDNAIVDFFMKLTNSLLKHYS